MLLLPVITPRFMVELEVFLLVIHRLRQPLTLTMDKLIAAQ